MMTIPNLISAGKFPVAIGVAWLAAHDQMVAAFVYLLVGAGLDLADGITARLLDQESAFGRDALEPVSDMALASAAVFGLCWSGVWSWWLAVGLVLIAGGLQAIHQFRNASNLMRRLKRVQHVVHPMYFVCIIAMVAFQYAWVAAGDSTVWQTILMMSLALAMIAGAIARRGWLTQKWHEGATA